MVVRARVGTRTMAFVVVVEVEGELRGCCHYLERGEDPWSRAFDSCFVLWT
jgi:hypothetical protein